MKLRDKATQIAINHPKIIVWVMVVTTVLLSLLMVRVKVDTDPENMLSEKEAVRIFHDRVKKEFNLYDMVVLGVVNEKNPHGIFNPTSLDHIYQLTQFAKALQDKENPSRRVVAKDIMAPSNLDAIIQAGPGQVRFEWLMHKPPKTQAQADQIKAKAMSNPLFNGTLVSEDGKALAVYLPITQKDYAYTVRQALLEKIKGFGGNDQFYITGLPVAEDTFGVEMFVQMAISAPLAMIMIFLLMLFFFKNIRLVISPMIIAMVSVLCTMGLLIGTGNTVHIMSSMIPIFLMPIAVVDSVHILSEFFDRYRQTRDRRKTIQEVMQELFMPMLYTSLTSTAGFLSLALTPIPPVKVFGLFVAFGIMLAWVLTILFVPAYVMLLNEEALDNIGNLPAHKDDEESSTRMARALRKLGEFTYVHAKLIVLISAGLIGIAGYGISKIQVNDNPVKWFHKGHDIRIADRVLNKHFGGTYEAYLVLEGEMAKLTSQSASDKIRKLLAAGGPFPNPQTETQATALLTNAAQGAPAINTYFERLTQMWEKAMDAASDETYDFWANGLDAIDQVRHQDQVFKRPDVLKYLSALQKHLLETDTVGKSTSVSDVVKKVHQELYESNPAQHRIPDSVNAVAQTLISYQNSHKPDDLWHLVTPDYKTANIWVQLKNGDNKGMEATVQSIERYIAANPPPVPLKHAWAGLTYLNVVWQNKMVLGMLNSFLSSFAVVFIMMVVLFRSVLWGILSMIPLSVTIALIYGIIGIIGKDYDMPVAVLSALTLGLAVDFAIHFLERARVAVAQTGSWQKGIHQMFEEPARAISRNIIVIAVGFTPLLLAPLVPYQTVGIFLASIMAVSGFATIVILPALNTLVAKWLFAKVTQGTEKQNQIMDN